MVKQVFITSTDTSVGKTVVTQALIQALKASGAAVMGFKPVARGDQPSDAGWRNHDALHLQRLSSWAMEYPVINPIVSDSEGYIARGYPVNYSLLSDNLGYLSRQADYVVVEGTGGWRSLLHDLRPLSEWVVQEQLPVILVVGIQPGCLNHALLTAQAIIGDGLPLIGWVANRINPGIAHYAQLLDVLAKKIPAPRLGELPYLPRAHQRDLSPYINFAMLNKALGVQKPLADDLEIMDCGQSLAGKAAVDARRARKATLPAGVLPGDSLPVASAPFAAVTLAGKKPGAKNRRYYLPG